MEIPLLIDIDNCFLRDTASLLNAARQTRMAQLFAKQEDERDNTALADQQDTRQWRRPECVWTHLSKEGTVDDVRRSLRKD